MSEGQHGIQITDLQTRRTVNPFLDINKYLINTDTTMATAVQLGVCNSRNGEDGNAKRNTQVCSKHWN